MARVRGYVTFNHRESRTLGRTFHLYSNCALMFSQGTQDGGTVRVMQVEGYKGGDKYFIPTLENLEPLQCNECTRCLKKEKAGTPEPKWERGECFGSGDPRFFDTGRGTKAIKVEADLREEYCDHCNIREACLEWATMEYLDKGFWGGTNWRQRQRIRSERNL
jgi:hypothetical protein